MSISEFALLPGKSTRQVLKALRAAHEDHLAAWGWGFDNVTWHVERRRQKGAPDKYVFGLLTLNNEGLAVRDTLTAAYDSGSGVVRLAFPSHPSGQYPGFERLRPFDKLRVMLRDQIVYKSGIVDRQIDDRPL